MLLLLWAARNTPRKWHLVWYLLSICVYPVLGWFALLFMLCLMISQKPTWREFFGIVLLLFTASIWRALLYSNLHFDDVVLAGFPRFSRQTAIARICLFRSGCLVQSLWLCPVVYGNGRLGAWRCWCQCCVLWQV